MEQDSITSSSFVEFSIYSVVREKGSERVISDNAKSQLFNIDYDYLGVD